MLPGLENRNQKTESRRASLAQIALCCVLSALCFLFSSGCNIVAPVAAIAMGPPKIEAVYTLQDVPTVVFVDDRSDLVNPMSLRRTIADVASQQLMVGQVVTATISPNDAMLIAARSDRASNLMSVEDIGRAVGAQQVIVVKMTKFQDTPDGYTPRPLAIANVKVIDLNRHTVWPENPAEGWAVNVSGAPVDPSLYASRSTRLKIYESLAAQLGAEVGRLFFKHDYKELGERVTVHP